jgi:hypothetical protein
VKSPDLGKMVGPLPLGGWLAVVGGGLGLAYKAHKVAPAATVKAASGSVTAADGTVGNLSGQYVSGAGGVVRGATVTLPGTPATGGTTTYAPQIQSNEDWLRQAVLDLVGRGYVGYTAQQALQSYLEGNQLSADQARIVESALRIEGPPPFSPVLAPAPIPDPGPMRPSVPIAAPTPAAPAPATPPAAATTCPNLPADLMQRIHAGGEDILTVMSAPGGGCWYFGTLGGVFAMGGAPFYGSARPNGFGAERHAVAVVPLGNGYRIVSNLGENYDYPG